MKAESSNIQFFVYRKAEVTVSFDRIRTVAKLKLICESVTLYWAIPSFAHLPLGWGRFDALSILVDKKNTDKICTLGPLACTELSVQNFVRVQNGSKNFSDFCPQFNQNSGLLQSIAFDVYRYLMYRQIKETIWVTKKCSKSVKVYEN